MSNNSLEMLYRYLQEMNWHELSIIAVYSNALLVDADLNEGASEAEELLSQMDRRAPDADRPDTVPMDAIFSQLGDLPPDILHALGQFARKLMDDKRFSPESGVKLGESCYQGDIHCRCFAGCSQGVMVYCPARRGNAVVLGRRIRQCGGPGVSQVLTRRGG